MDNDNDNNNNNNGDINDNNNNNNNNNNNDDNDNNNNNNDNGGNRRRGPNFFMYDKHFNCSTMNKNNGKINCNSEELEETPENLKRWLLIDSATTTSVGVNKNIFHSMQEAENPAGIISNGGELDLNLTAEMDGVGRMPFSEDGIANLFGMNDLIKRGFRVHMDSDEENAIFVEKNNEVRKFITSNGGLYFHDLWNDSMSFEKQNKNNKIKNNIFMQSQKENSMWYTKRQIKKAKEARNLHQMMMYPSTADFKNAIKLNFMHDCPVTVEDITYR